MTGGVLQLTGLFEVHRDTEIAFATTCLFWDCECVEDYIHPANENECPICDSKREDQPPSRVQEVIRYSSRLPRGLVGIVESMQEACGEEPIPF
jgi:hypothetical protein